MAVLVLMRTCVQFRVSSSLRRTRLREVDEVDPARVKLVDGPTPASVYFTKGSDGALPSPQGAPLSASGTQHSEAEFR